MRTDGIDRDRTGTHEKTRHLDGKQGIFNRDGAASGGSSLGQLEIGASARSASFFHALDSPGEAQDGGGAAGRIGGPEGRKALKIKP